MPRLRIERLSGDSFTTDMMFPDTDEGHKEAGGLIGSMERHWRDSSPNRVYHHFGHREYRITTVRNGDEVWSITLDETIHEQAEQ